MGGPRSCWLERIRDRDRGGGGGGGGGWRGARQWRQAEPVVLTAQWDSQ